MKAEALGDGEEGIDLGVVQPGAAEIDGHAEGRRVGMGTAADALARLQDAD